jgi:hypothetical protein
MKSLNFHFLYICRWDGSGAKNPNIEAKISFTTKNVIKQNISQITSRVRQLFRITGL